MEVARLPRLASGVVKQGSAGTDDAAVRRAEGFGDAVPLENGGAGGLGMPGQLLVEAQARADQAVGGEIGDFRPGQLDSAAACDQPEALVAPPATLFGVRQAELLDLADGARSEPVAADLFAREPGFSSTVTGMPALAR